ncbi:uncharacterized protein PGTG_20779 [Puccinia graminis f. sp. tritici CRL 75-36-700-3]|uniref:Uncharacterized protein n=1 Tax=Puccinia graminis f. sp. tritici (strain CRL 75-36-700-3 / race SCCL) TaxID=418459 RepID=H6QP86_PUCGT|nr:uncharacterized protein PGTG_20779 [Puccinia graminis f. sp. tritici CRL 75-36-700-3]EHS63200.1 hypothetical protein PGTG_20779 [Puccinia graminis f. sp. tritici CRL 75-36-700-3]
MSEWLSETDKTQQPLWDNFNCPGGACWPVVGNVVERLDESLEIFQESLEVTRPSSNATPGCCNVGLLRT